MSESFPVQCITQGGTLLKEYTWTVNTNSTLDLTFPDYLTLKSVEVLPTSYTVFGDTVAGNQTKYYTGAVLAIGQELVVTHYFSAGSTTWDHRIKFLNNKTIRSYQNYIYGNSNSKFFLKFELQ